MTKETEYVKTLLRILGRQDKLDLLNKSNLTDRDITMLTRRFVYGHSLKEIAYDLGIEVNSLSKAQLKAVKKLYLYLQN